jgi:putative ABC transport system substrate-binding protein
VESRRQIIDLAAEHKPAMQGTALVEAGGLIFDGASDCELLRRSASYVDRALKGPRPGNLPLEQPTALELVINAKTAKALGLTIPPLVLARAIES